MLLLAASYDLTNYTAVRAVCIILSLILAGIVLAIAITNYIREGKLLSTGSIFSLSDDKDVSPEDFSAEEPQEESAEPVEALQTEAAEEPQEEPAEPVEALQTEAAEESAEPVTEEQTAVEAAEEPQAEVAAAVAEETVAEEPAEPVSETQTDSDALPAFFGKLTRTMTDEEKAGFAELLVGDGKVEKTRLKYPLTEYAEDSAFLKDFFLSAGKFKMLIPMGAMEKLYKKRLGQLTTDAETTRLNNKMIAFYFARRKTEETALDKCIKLCKKDVAFNYENRDVRGMKLPALKRLILIYTAQKRYEEAIKLCDEAITREIIEKKDEGYEERRSRIVGKMNKAAEIAAAKAAKAEAKAAKLKAAEEKSE